MECSGCPKPILGASYVSMAWICRSSRNAFYKAFIESIEQEVGSHYVQWDSFSDQNLYLVSKPRYLMWKFDGSFTKTETVIQLQDFVKLPDQLFTHSLLFHMRSNPFSIFSQKGHVWSFIIYSDSCASRTLQQDSSVLCQHRHIWGKTKERKERHLLRACGCLTFSRIPFNLKDYHAKIWMSFLHMSKLRLSDYMMTG